MKNKFQWTPQKARLQLAKVVEGQSDHWLFLPGGPGLGSESLRELLEMLHLPGNSWYLDLPGDGSNTTTNDAEYFSHWAEALIEAIKTLENVILVAHSTGGMFALATPEVESLLKGLVLMSSAPDASWQNGFKQYVQANPLPEADKLHVLYEKNPSNEMLKALTIASAPYFSMPANLHKTNFLLESLPFNYHSCQWAEKNFDQTYQAKWIPQKLPTLILAGDHDPITPLKLFLDLPEFQRENILIREIKNASHFPWLDNPQEIKQVFAEYCQFLRR